MKPIRILVAATAGLVGLSLSPSARTQPSYPSQPVRMIVAFGQGSGTDVIARYMADALSRRMKQQFLVENRPGAAGNVGLAYGAKQPADGYTMVLGGLGVNVMNQFLYPPGSLGFSPEKDLDPVILVAKLPFVIAAGAKHPAEKLDDLIAIARQKPQSVEAAVTTTTSRMVMELINRNAGVELLGVPYRVPANAIVDVIAGRVALLLDTAASLRPHVTSGSLKALAVTSRSSSDVMPGVRSAIEQGLAQFEFVGWVSIYMPRGAPPAAIALMNREFDAVLSLPETRRRFIDLGMEAGSGSPADMAEFEASERRRWGALIQSAGITAD